HYNWRNLYVASEDYRSPFFEREYSEFEFTNKVYNFLLHPQWDDFGADTLFIKIIFADYDKGFAIIEMIGEWNDCIENDIMNLKLEVFEILIQEGIDKFIMIGENVLNFHSSDDCYYEELFDEVEEGWIVFLNFHPHVLEEFSDANIDSYVIFGEDFDLIEWRKHKPDQLFDKIRKKVDNRFDLPLLD
ncbi:MAG: hypothetical protein ABF258_10990, partial [Flavobacteriales bacterium]